MNPFPISRRPLLALAAACILVALSGSSWAVEPKPKREHPKPLVDIPLRSGLDPKPEVPVFADASSGLRVLISRDDGKTWKQSLLVSDDAGDGGHGPYGVHGFVYADGMFSIYSGWGSSGYWLGSVDGENWAHLSSNKEGTSYPNVLGAAAAPGILVSSGSGSVSVSQNLGKTWEILKMRSLDIRTHHMKCACGDYDGDRIVVAGDGPMVIYSKDKGKTWKSGDISGGYTQNNGRFFVAGNMVYGNGVFLINSGDQGTVTRSTDGGETWSKKIVPGTGRIAYRGLSFVRGEFWLPGRRSRASKDGLTWRDLADSVPPGPVAESDGGTLICATGDKIYRSRDGVAWKVVFTAPEKSSSWTLRHVAFGRVRNHLDAANLIDEVTTGDAGSSLDDQKRGGQKIPRPLAQAAGRVAEGLMNGTVEVRGYRRQLAWEALLRLGKAADEQSYLDWVIAESEKSGLVPGSEANRRRGPFNCLVYWLYEATGDKDWLPGFIKHTRRYQEKVARSPEGAILHPRGKRRGGGQAMLIDALQDYASRMAMLGRATGDDSCYEEAVRQFRLYREVVRNPKTGLWSQGRGWLKDPTALSPGAWSRGHGWLIRGMVDTLLLLPPDSRESEELRGYLRELADALLKVQQPGGMWHCLLHRPPSQSPPETSGTALIAGNLAMAVDAGFLDKQPYGCAARRAFAALPAYVDEQGIVHSVSPGPGPLAEEEPWAVEAFPLINEHGSFALLFAALGSRLIEPR